MNEKINIFFIISIILFSILVFLSIFFGSILYDNGNTITEIETESKELRNQVSGFKLGFNLISSELKKIGKINTELRETVIRLETDKRRYTKNLESLYNELEQSNTELNRIRIEAERRNKEAITASTGIREDINEIRKIIEEIENKPDN